MGKVQFVQNVGVQGAVQNTTISTNYKFKSFIF